MADAKTQGRAIGGRREVVALALTVLLLVATLASFFNVQVRTDRNQDWLDLAREVNSNAARLTRVSRETTQGFEPDFRALEDTRVEFTELIGTLKAGDAESNLPAAPSALQADVLDLDELWTEMQPALEDVIANSEIYLRTSTNAANIINESAAARALYEQLAQRPVVRGSSGLAVNVAVQLVRLERLGSIARGLLGIGGSVSQVIEELEVFTRDFERTQTQILVAALDPESRELAEQAKAAFQLLAQAVAGVQSDAEAIQRFQDSGAGLFGTASTVITAAFTVEQGLLDYVFTNPVETWPIYVLGGGALVVLVIFVALNLISARERVARAEERDARQQKAILGLLDEITNLADGDLTVDVTVTEDFTGAIADSINYTVSSLRNLVGTINSSSAEITRSASGTEQLARRMNEASERQAKEITAVTNTVAATSQSLQQVAGRAEQLAQQAQGSVQTAHAGSLTVGRTIQGMAALREQIQDTSKRIKRLGESSQEIGTIIEFINDIAEQTNTLALNASIQAAMAGDAGRGFAVVADEVQRLAERAANATRQIETLVKTIQADTNEAIISMERSTQNVVGGAQSAEEAGQALAQIESSSQELSKLIQDIALAARNQSAAATKIAGTMQVIREIAVQTSGSAGQTAKAVGEMNRLSDKLRDSVAGFKLPGTA